jgi:hypothetical protein
MAQLPFHLTLKSLLGPAHLRFTYIHLDRGESSRVLGLGRFFVSTAPAAADQRVTLPGSGVSP